MSTTSGCSQLHRCDRFLAVGGGADEIDVVGGREQLFEPAANDGVIVGDHHPDCHGRMVMVGDGHRGISTCSVVPAPGLERTSSRPPASVTSPRRAMSPKCPRARLVVASVASKPRPSSTRSSTRHRCAGSRRCEPTWPLRGRACSAVLPARLRYSSRAAESGSGSSSSMSRSTRSPRSLPREQVGHGRVERDLVEVGWVDVDDQGAQRPNAAANRFGGIFDHFGIGTRGTLPTGRRRERVGDTGKVLDRAIVEIGCNLAALDVARFERPVQQQLSFPQPHAEAARQRPGDRDLHDLQHQQCAERDRGEAAPQAIAVPRDERVVVVGLEQQPLPGGRADRQVDLEQLAVRALVAVLGLGQVADVGFDRAGIECAAFVGARARRARRSGAARRSTGRCPVDSRPSPERASRRGRRAARHDPPARSPPSNPRADPSVTAGSTRFWARMTADERASVIASRSPMRRLATAVARPTITSRITPTNAN